MSKPIFRWTRHVLRLAGIHDDIVTPICEAHLTGHLERQTWMPATSAGDDGRGGFKSDRDMLSRTVDGRTINGQGRLHAQHSAPRRVAGGRSLRPYRTG